MLARFCTKINTALVTRLDYRFVVLTRQLNTHLDARLQMYIYIYFCWMKRLKMYKSFSFCQQKCVRNHLEHLQNWMSNSSSNVIFWHDTVGTYALMPNVEQI